MKAMFSGIIEELGEVKRISRRGAMALLEIGACSCADNARIGDSIAVNGACLTLVQALKGTLSFEVMSETIRRTNLGFLNPGNKVNLERALKVGDRISGHFVTGHIDTLGMIRKKAVSGGNLAIEIAVPQEYMKFILAKGSVCVDGISLTVAGKKSNTFSVFIIPHTLKNTTLGFKGPSDKVNIEFDILVKGAASIQP